MTTNHRVSLQPGVVLHTRAYRDTSLLLELFTLEHGRIGAVARGVRKEKSRWAGILQPFRAGLFSWSGRGDLVTLTGAEEDGAAESLSGAVAMCGFYVNELVMRLLQRHDAHAALYQAYRDALRELARIAGNDASMQERALRTFEKRMLDDLGYGLILDRAADSGEPLQPECIYSYELERGPVAFDAQSSGVAICGATLLSIAQEELNDERSLRESKRLMRAVLAHYLGDQPLHSRELIRHSVRHAHDLKA